MDAETAAKMGIALVVRKVVMKVEMMAVLLAEWKVDSMAEKMVLALAVMSVQLRAEMMDYAMAGKMVVHLVMLLADKLVL